MLMSENEFYSKARTLEEMAAFIGVTSRFLRQEIYRGKLRARKFS
jgi:hypothetical protein